MSNSVDPDQTAPLALHCLHMRLYQEPGKTYGTDKKAGLNGGVVLISCGRNSGILLYNDA